MQIVLQIDTNKAINDLQKWNNKLLQLKDTQVKNIDGPIGSSDTIIDGGISSVEKVQNNFDFSNISSFKDLAKVIYDMSQIYVPVDTGRLKASGRILRNSIDTYSIVYHTPYAGHVHEIVNHHVAPTRDHFLSDAANEIRNLLAVESPMYEFTYTIDVSVDFVALHLNSLPLKMFNERKKGNVDFISLVSMFNDGAYDDVVVDDYDMFSISDYRYDELFY